MRIFLFVLTLLLTIAVCFVLDTRLMLPAPLGKLLSPQHGIWQNAEPVDARFSTEFNFPQLSKKVEVYFDERLVPHVFAEEENDAYFVQGFIHAKYRLWQMEIQCLAAAGRASEILGEKALDHDRDFRRLGMVYGAENSLRAMEENSVIKAECDAYTAGVNAYIESLTESTLPFEYKLIGYYPEKWSNFKSALFLKYMSHELAAHENDFELTKARNYFGPELFRKLFPAWPDSLDPVIPSGTVYPKPAIDLGGMNIDSITAASIVPLADSKPDPDNGSNNWAVAGTKTRSGSPILCNDPHLGLNLPSLWFEMQITTPTFNVYGVTFPGAPSVIIGFNDYCAWGVTNGGRDVLDYYEITFKDQNRKEYLFNGEWLKTSFRYETIKVSGKADFTDTVAYTVFGPVRYDGSFGTDRTSTGKSYAARWKAHDPSNELLVFNLMNRAKNYDDYLAAVKNMETPGQNFAFAAKNGDIALRAQGHFPAKWKEQGDYIMPGTDSSFLWKGTIPQDEVPEQFNPERQFVSSANQHPADSAYPYYLGRDYPTIRGLLINRILRENSNFTVEDMMRMQNNNYNLFAERAMPIFRQHLPGTGLTTDENKYRDLLLSWNLNNDNSSTGATVFELLWKAFYASVYDDEYGNAPNESLRPLQATLLEMVLREPENVFIDNISTPYVESLGDIVATAFKKIIPELQLLEKEKRLEWGRYKDTRVSHITKLEALSRLHLPIGGGTNIINATKEKHGPSWRMIVQLSQNTEAYGVYPGGQSGNPGSRFYDNFVDHWAAGKYYKLWVMQPSDKKSKNIISTMNFHP